MSHTRSFRLSVVLLAALCMSLAPGAAAQKEKGKKKEKEPPPQGTALLWRDPGDVSALDLLLGPGGAEMKPDLSRLTFLKEEKGGYSKKYRVRDAAGRVWVAKIGKEAQPETAVTRLVWAAGYPVEVTYLAPCVKIADAPKQPKEAEQCEGGGYANVRFEARPENVKRLDPWRWDSNPFSGTRELRGLKIMMALVENWDLKDDNNRVLAVSGASGTELQHIVSDLGATIGKTGGQNGPISFIRQVKGTRNEPGDYAADKFIDGVEGGRVIFNFSGKNSGLMRDITVEDARWLGGILSRLTDKQIEDAFRAANYNTDEVRMLAASVRARIEQLTNPPAGGAPTP